MALDIRPFTKRPVQVDAVQVTAQNIATVADWCRGDVHTRPALRLRVPTLEGVLWASVGDWIVRGVIGEFHPVREDIFARTYDEA